MDQPDYVTLVIAITVCKVIQKFLSEIFYDPIIFKEEKCIKLFNFDIQKLLLKNKVLIYLYFF